MEQNGQNFSGAMIRKLRIEQGFTQEMLAARCGVAGYEISRGTLAKIEAQIRKVSDAELFVIAKALGVNIEQLFPSDFKTRLKRGDFLKDI